MQNEVVSIWRWINFVASLEPSEILYTVSYHFMENVKLSNKRISLTFDDNSVATCDGSVVVSGPGPRMMTANVTVLGPSHLISSWSSHALYSPNNPVLEHRLRKNAR